MLEVAAGSWLVGHWLALPTTLLAGALATAMWVSANDRFHRSTTASEYNQRLP